MPRRLFCPFILLVFPVLLSASDAIPNAERASAYPNADAVILRWDQHWTVPGKGERVYEEHRWVLMRSDRAIGHFADPRIDMLEGRDEVEILTARTHTPDGRIVDVADYARNLLSPGDVDGYPAYSAWRQWVLSFRVEAGAVLELHTRTQSRDDLRPWLSAHLRLNGEYPTLERQVRVTVPRSIPVRYSEPPKQPPSASGDGLTTYAWQFRDLAGEPDEPQSPPWSRRCGSLTFSTCPGRNTLVSSLCAAAAKAVATGPGLEEFAGETAKSEPDTKSGVRSLLGKLRKRFQLVPSAKTWESLTARPADAVFKSGYGNPIEWAGMVMALLKHLDIEAEPAVVLDIDVGSEAIALPQQVRSLAVIARIADEQLCLSPEWGAASMIPPGTRVEVFSAYGEEPHVRAWPEQRRSGEDMSLLRLVGDLDIDEKGGAKGNLLVTCTGLFANPGDLVDKAAQKNVLQSYMGSLLEGFRVEDFEVRSLTEERFEARATVAADPPTETPGGMSMFAVLGGPATLGKVPLPLDDAHRRTDVWLAGRCREEVELRIKPSDKWSVQALPAALPAVDKPWGSARLDVASEDGVIKLRRNLTLSAAVIPVAEFETLRATVNTLRSDRYKWVALSKSEDRK